MPFLPSDISRILLHLVLCSLKDSPVIPLWCFGLSNRGLRYKY